MNNNQQFGQGFTPAPQGQGQPQGQGHSQGQPAFSQPPIGSVPPAQNQQQQGGGQGGAVMQFEQVAPPVQVNSQGFLDNVSFSAKDVIVPFIKIAQPTGKDTTDPSKPINFGDIYNNNNKVVMAEGAKGEKIHFNVIHFTKHIVTRVYEGNQVGANLSNVQPVITKEPFIDDPQNPANNENTIVYDPVYDAQRNITYTRQVEYNFFILPYDRANGQLSQYPHRLILSKTNVRAAKDLISKAYVRLSTGEIKSPFQEVYSMGTKTMQKEAGTWAVFGEVSIAGYTNQNNHAVCMAFYNDLVAKVQEGKVGAETEEESDKTGQAREVLPRTPVGQPLGGQPQVQGQGQPQMQGQPQGQGQVGQSLGHQNVSPAQTPQAPQAPPVNQGQGQVGFNQQVPPVNQQQPAAQTQQVAPAPAKKPRKKRTTKKKAAAKTAAPAGDFFAQKQAETAKQEQVAQQKRANAPTGVMTQSAVDEGVDFPSSQSIVDNMNNV